MVDIQRLEEGRINVRPLTRETIGYFSELMMWMFEPCSREVPEVMLYESGRIHRSYGVTNTGIIGWQDGGKDVDIVFPHRGICLTYDDMDVETQFSEVVVDGRLVGTYVRQKTCNTGKPSHLHDGNYFFIHKKQLEGE